MVVNQILSVSPITGKTVKILPFYILYAIFFTTPTSNRTCIQLPIPPQSFTYTHLYRNLEPMRKKFCLADGPFTGARRRKKAWCSTAHFHRCLHAFSLCNLEIGMRVLMIKNMGCKMGRKYTIRRSSWTKYVTCKEATRNIHINSNRRSKQRIY